METGVPACEASVIPCIDLATIRKLRADDKEKFLQQFKSDVSEWGIFQVNGHGVSVDLLKRLNAWGQKFFSMPLEARMKTCVSHSVGYMVQGGDPSRGSGLQLIVRPQNPVSTEIDELWLSPEDQKLFKKDIDEYCESMKVLTMEILELLEDSVFGGEKRGHFTNAFKSYKDGHGVKFNHYAPCEDGKGGAHTDPNIISILHQDTPGLQALKDGQEVICKADPESLVINVADSLEVLSNKVFPSVLHRGGHDRHVSRISIVYFACSSSDFKLVPAEELIDEHHPAVEACTMKDLATAKYLRNSLLENDH